MTVFTKSLVTYDHTWDPASLGESRGRGVAHKRIEEPHTRPKTRSRHTFVFACCVIPFVSLGFPVAVGCPWPARYADEIDAVAVAAAVW